MAGPLSTYLPGLWKYDNIIDTELKIWLSGNLTRYLRSNLTQRHSARRIEFSKTWGRSQAMNGSMDSSWPSLSSYIDVHYV